MLHHNQANVSIAHRVEPTTMNGSTERSIQQPHRNPVVNPGPVGADEPLDLTKPLDLSKRSSKPLPPAALQQHYVPNGTPRHVQAGVHYINLHHHLGEVHASNAPPLRSTKYPLQRGLAYVQPRKAVFSRNGGIPEARVSDPQGVNSSQRKVVGPEQQAMRNYAAMQQRVRSEAANIAALQAQATNAAQEAVKQAMARHAAATAAKARKEARSAALSAGDVAHLSHTQNQMFDAQRKRLHTGRMASVKPVQRKISAADIQAYAMEKQFARLSAMREMQSEQDLLRAYRQMMASTKTTSNAFAKQPNNRPQPDSSPKTATTHEPALPKQLPVATDGHSARGYEANHTHYSPEQQRMIDSQIAARKQNGFAAQVRAREQAMVKQQQELIMRQQRQLVKDVNNNRRLLEFAKTERNRKAMMEEFNNKQLATRIKMRQEPGLAKRHVGQTAGHASPEYLEALAAYNAARRGESQQRTVRGVSHTMSQPSMHSMSIPQQGVRKPLPSIPRDDRSSVQSNSPQSEVNTASKVYASTKRPSMSPHDESIPRKIQATSPDTQASNIFNNAIAEVHRSVVAQQLLMNTYKGMTGKKLSSVPVRERLLMARLSDRDRHELMVTKMVEGQAMREQKDSSPGNKNTLNNIASTSEDETPHAARRAHENLTRSVDKPTSNHHVPISSQNRLSKNIVSPGIRRNEESSAENLAQASLMKPSNETAQVQPALKRPRLPSYDDAMAAQKSLTPEENSEKLTSDTMSTVARQLVSSSQDWFKNYLSREMEQQANSLSHNDQAKLDKRILTGDGHSSSKDTSASKQVATSPVIESARQPTTEQKSLKESEEHVVGKEANSSSDNVVRKPSPTLPPTPPILDALGLGGRGQLGDNTKTNGNDAGAKSAIDVKRSFAKAFSDVYLTQSLGHSEMEPLSGQTKPAHQARAVSPEKQSEEALPKNTDVELEQQKICDETPDPSKGSEVRRAENDLMQADTALLGSEERALQRAILRFNVPERQVSGSDQAEETPALERTGKTNSRLKEAQRRKRRKLSKFRKRIRGPRIISSVTNIPGLQSGRKRGRPRRSSLPPPSDMEALMRTKFQDFIPTVLERRTRNSGSGRVRNYRAMYDARNIRYELEIEKERAKVIERRRRLREFNNVENASATETDEPAQDEDYVPLPIPKRPRGRPRTKPRDENSGSPAKQNTERVKEDVPPSEEGAEKDEESPPKPLRVVLDQNTPNHIKMKFVNIRSMSTNEAQEEEVVAPPQPRRRGRPRKSDGKCKRKTKNLGPPKSPEPPKLEMMWPCGNKENESDYEDFVQDPDYDTNPDLTLPEYARDIRPDPPQDMKRFPLNKKLGETFLHRAASQGNMEILSYCIDYRVVDVNARDNAGYTALHESCVEGHVDIAQYLLSHGADVNASAADGTRPIHDAVDNDRVQLVRLLLAYGADPFLATNTGRRITKLALTKSSEMKTMLFGYLQDVNGVRSKLEDAPQHALDYQWSFSGSCSAFDTNTSSETYIFADVPGPEDGKKTDSGEEDEGVFFEISDKPILPSYNIRMDSDDKFRNWLLLSDVTKRLSLTSQELMESHPELERVTVPACQFHQSAQESQIMKTTLAVRAGDDVNDNSEVKGEEVTLLELNDSLRNVLCMDVKYIR